MTSFGKIDPDHTPGSAAYYALTERSYRAFCDDDGGHMNVGLWPSPTLRVAQERLVGWVLERARRRWHESHPDRVPSAILDLGSGWGGSRPLFRDAFADSRYVGINLSSAQVESARQRNREVPHTDYVVGAVEEEATLDAAQPFELVVSIEAAFHFTDKELLLQRLARRRVVLLFADILIESTNDGADTPLLRWAMGHSWSRARYEVALERAGFTRLSFERLPGRPLHDAARYLDRLDNPGDRSAWVGRGGRRALFHPMAAGFRHLGALEDAGLAEYRIIAADASSGGA